MLWVSSLDERARDVGFAELERDRDNFDSLRMKLIAQCLPPGQVKPAASIRCPGDEHYLLAAQ